jgi:hypothetical protein
MEDGLKKHEESITAIKQARALDKMAENARELGLDYETVDGTQVSKVWWDGEKLMAKPIPFVEFYRPVQQKPSCKDCRTESPCRAKGQDFDVCSVYVPPPTQEFVCSTGLCHYKATSDARLMEMPQQEPVGTLNIWFYKGHGNYDFDYWGSLGEGTYTVHVAKSEAPSHNSTCNETLRAQGKSYPITCKKCGLGPCVGKPKSDTTPPAAAPVAKHYVDGGHLVYPAAQRPWQSLTDDEVIKCTPTWGGTVETVARAVEAKLKEKNT